MMVTGTELAVCTDIAERQRLGIKKYGTTVRENKKDLDFWQQSLYEELLDAAIYLKRIMEERKNESIKQSESQ